jgi:hypothetical protein
MKRQVNSNRNEGPGMKKLFGLAFTLLLALSLVGGAAKARPEQQVTQFDVSAGDPFTEAFSGVAGLGDVAQASNGDTIKVIFTGHFDVKDHEAEGKGTFEHFNSSGTLLEFGTFQAHHLISFTDFGTSAGLSPTFHGGTALILVRGVRYDNSDPTLNTTSKFKATLRVDCLIGNPPAGLEEGINFAISGGLNFDEKPSNHGFTSFVTTED